MEDDRRPLLGRPSEDRPDDEAIFGKAPFVARFLGALSQGKLPNNDQLYTLFHKAASFLDGISTSVTSSLDSEDANDTEEGEVGGILSDDTAMTIGTFLKESSALSRLLAKWLYGEEAKDEPKMKDGERQGSRGNEREQIQRLLWHLSQAFSLDTSLPLAVGVDVPVDVKKANETVQEGAKQVKDDTIASGKSLVQLIVLVLGSEELRRIPSDLIHYMRSTAADQVAEVAARVDNVERALRGPEGDGGGEEVITSNGTKDFAEPEEALREAAKSTQAVIAGVQNGKGKERQNGDAKDLEHAFRDQVITRIARLIDSLQDNDQYQSAVKTIIAVSEKYLSLLDKAKEDVSVSLNQADGDDGAEKMQSLASEGAEKIQEEVKATLSSAHFDSKITAKVSHHFLEAFNAFRQVLEGFAGGRSTVEIVEKMSRIKEDVEKDSALRDWLGDVNDFLSRSVGLKEGSNVMDMSTEEAKRDLHYLYARLQELLKSRPDILEAFDDLKSCCLSFYADIEADVALHRVRSRFNRILQLATLTIWEGAQDVKSKASQIASLLINAIVPTIGDILGSIPIPRVEFASDNLDAVVEDVVIPVVSLIPDTINITTMNDWQWNRNPRRKWTTQSNLDTNLKLSMRGLQLAITDISFYVQERFTAPPTAGCMACCSFGHSQSKWCILRGPSSWFAYTESALLDVGFWRRGLGVSLDLRDAGQDESQSKKSKKAQDEIWNDDTSTEGKRNSFFKVNNVDVHVGNSFDFKLRDSRHWILNSLLRVTSRPIIKVILRRIISAQVQYGYELLDSKLWDYHYRAKRISLARDERSAIWEKQGGAPALRRQDTRPSMWDYITVLMDAQAGKSKARIRMEEKGAEDERVEAERQKQAQEQEAEEARITSQQPKPKKTMEVKSTSIIKHDANGAYSLSIGLAPRLLDESQRGPKTDHIRLRDDLVNRNYKNLANRPKQRVIQTFDQVDVQDTMTKAAEEVQKGASLVTDTIEGTKAASNVVAKEDSQADDGWRSDAFDL